MATPSPLQRSPMAPANRQAAAVAKARGPVVVELEYPIQAHGEEITSIEFRRPTTGDLLAIDGLGDIAGAAKLVELLGAIPPSSVKALDPVDFAKCADTISGFFETSRPTGRRR